MLAFVKFVWLPPVIVKSPLPETKPLIPAKPSGLLMVLVPLPVPLAILTVPFTFLLPAPVKRTVPLLRTSGSVMSKVPFSSNVAPLLIVVEPSVVPSPLALPMFMLQEILHQALEITVA